MLVACTLPWLVWRLGRVDHWAPLVVVQIVAGIVLAVRRLLPRLCQHVLVLLMPVCFLSTGLGKLAGVHLAGRILGWQRGEASAIVWLLQTTALIMISVANVLLGRSA